MMRCFYILIVILLSACQGNRDEFHLENYDPEIDLTFIQNFEKASNQWYEAIGRKVEITEDGWSTLRIEDVIENKERIHGKTYHNDEDSIMYIKRKLSNDMQYETILHEIGHHFGCRHSDNPEDVMYPWTGYRGLIITQNDINCTN